MTKYARPYRRVDTAKGHHYKDANTLRVPGVTTLLSQGLPKPALINWAANATADGALDAWDDLCAMSPAKRLDYLKRVRYAVRDEAANRGTAIHTLGADLVAGETVEVPPELTGYVEGYAKFLDAFDVTPVEVEFSVASYRHAYAGTADLIADLSIPHRGRVRMLIDLKSNRSGIFAETALQLAAYRYADVILDPDGGDHPMLEVEATAAVHITPTGSHLIPVETNEAIHRVFLYVAQVAAFERDGKDLIGPALAPATDSSYRLERAT